MSMYHEVIEALSLLVQILDQLGVVYYIGGSVSSAIHGTPRRTQDVDIIVALQLNQIHPFVQALQGTYYFDEQALQDAVRRGLPYNMLHLATMLKIDLIPLKNRAFTQEEARRAQAQVLEAGTQPLRVASAEDAVLTKLEWFEMGGRTSGRQWNDILGILKRQGAAIDLPYLRRWAAILGVRDLLEQALADAGFQQP
jgi:hypothetical protein